MSNKTVEILLVEDNPADALLTQEAFAKSQIVKNINIVDDGEKALAYLRQEEGYEGMKHPDLILLDLNLPKMDGREVLMELSLDPKLSSIPVIVLTSSTLEKDVMEAYGKGANSYIVKPIELEKFVKIVDAIECFWFAMASLPDEVSSG